MLNIIYKEMNGYGGYYSVGSNGTIMNKTKILKTFINNSGYKAIILTLNGTRKHYLIHRVVAEHFIDNPENKREVNHIDGNKLKNDVCNLEWVTSSENKQHACALGLWMHNTPSLGKKLSKTSKYYNVGYDAQRKKWIAVVRHKNKNHFQKRFNTEEEAALHVNWILDQLQLYDRPRNIIYN